MRIRWFHGMAAVLALLALPLVSLPVRAAGGGDPGPAPFRVSAPSATIDGDNTVVLTFTVSCIDQAVEEAAVVEIDGRVVYGQGRHAITGVGSIEVTCVPGVQTVEVPIAGNGRGFRPGPVDVFVEFHGCISTRCIQAFGSSHPIVHRAR